MPNISQPTQKLIERYQQWNQSLRPKEGSPTIHVDEVASKVAAFYEKIRGVIDWREEHLLKTGAIERMLKRRLFGQMDIANGNFQGEKVAESFVLELIRGGIFPNDKIEEVKIKKIQEIIDKYVYIANNGPKNPQKSKLRLYHWLSSIAACEIEDELNPSTKESALIAYMYGLMKEKIMINESVMKLKGALQEEKNIQIYIAVQKSLFKLDSQAISYHLLKYKYQNWQNLSHEELSKISNDIFTIWQEIEKDLNHPLADKIYQICERYDTPYLILGDIIAQDSDSAKEKISDPESLETLTRKAYTSRLKTLKLRLGRAAFYATVSIFITKIALALAVEIPLDKYLLGDFNYLAIAIDAFFPPLLMFFLIITIKPPKKENLELVIMELMKLVYPRAKEEIYEIRIDRKRGFIISSLVSLVYALSFIVSLGIIILCLYKLNFPIISYFIFIIFISLIAFTGTRLRQRSKELHVAQEKEGFLTIVLDLFALPLVQLGKWLMAKWKKYNIIAAIFNALIDMPFSIFVEFLEQWRYFLKEKKGKIH